MKRNQHRLAKIIPFINYRIPSVKQVASTWPKMNADQRLVNTCLNLWSQVKTGVPCNFSPLTRLRIWEGRGSFTKPPDRLSSVWPISVRKKIEAGDVLDQADMAAVGGKPAWSWLYPRPQKMHQARLQTDWNGTEWGLAPSVALVSPDDYTWSFVVNPSLVGRWGNIHLQAGWSQFQSWLIYRGNSKIHMGNSNATSTPACSWEGNSGL